MNGLAAFGVALAILFGSLAFGALVGAVTQDEDKGALACALVLLAASTAAIGYL